MIILLFLLLLPSTYCEAREFSFKKPLDIARLDKNLKSAGFAVLNTSCYGSNCKIIMSDSETKDPSAIIAAQPVLKSRAEEDAAVAALKSESEELEARIDTLTLPELRRLVKIMMKRLNISKDP